MRELSRWGRVCGRWGRRPQSAQTKVCRRHVSMPPDRESSCASSERKLWLATPVSVVPDHKPSAVVRSATRFRDRRQVNGRREESVVARTSSR
jgi:hypothetical protein